MSEPKVTGVSQQAEAPKVSNEATGFARGLLIEIKSALKEPSVKTDYSAYDFAHQQLLELDREMQERVGEGTTYFGHTRKLWGYLYEAMLAGYNPSAEQRAVAEDEGCDFMWDEVSELPREHPDIYEKFNSMGMALK